MPTVGRFIFVGESGTSTISKWPSCPSLHNGNVGSSTTTAEDPAFLMAGRTVQFSMHQHQVRKLFISNIGEKVPNLSGFSTQIPDVNINFRIGESQDILRRQAAWTLVRNDTAVQFRPNMPPGAPGGNGGTPLTSPFWGSRVKNTKGKPWNTWPASVGATLLPHTAGLSFYFPLAIVPWTMRP